MPSTVTAPCTRCHQVRLITGRDLCRTCHSHAARDGTLADYPRRNRPIADTIAEYQHLHNHYGLGPAQVAERLGLKTASLHRALQRARQRARKQAAAA